jgi:hypothetical protein
VLNPSSLVDGMLELSEEEQAHFAAELAGHEWV